MCLIDREHIRPMSIIEGRQQKVSDPGGAFGKGVTRGEIVGSFADDLDRGDSLVENVSNLAELPAQCLQALNDLEIDLSLDGHAGGS